MTGTELDRCTTCGAVLAPWEKGRCACTGPRSGTIREVLYSIACTARQPLHARDFVRNAERDHGLPFNMGTAVVMLSTDFRFCWAGRGLYGLYRHGPLPGPRKLREATRIVLLAAGTPLSHEAVDFCLKRLGYRFSTASLRQAVAKTGHIRWEHGQWDHSRGDAAELELRNQIPIVPPRQPRPWSALHAEITASVTASIADLAAKHGALADPSRFGLDWDPDLIADTSGRPTTPHRPQTPQAPSSSGPPASPMTTDRGVLYARGPDSSAVGLDTPEAFLVLKGSLARKQAANSLPKHHAHTRRNLSQLGVLVEEGRSYRFTTDWSFESASAAACVVLGGSANGLREWKDNQGTPLGDLRRA